ncbi:heterogeneous nuclear ribonucleoprotein U-like protein 1 [Thrips palmi]|uniref:Heterogeneous nuclear ribonucleoprotein U-like protein 1 n=1 Tax=Thrips palmi TaxID=161013 RepID=A0A6P9ADH7_THRPL|nr:heterogeneous nuclear ribonucleoprotein U-like protein 1 [Thrips palmi]
MARIASLVALTALAACLSCASAQYRSSQPQTTPVPILKQINRHNEDGSYSYGYEGADGSFKIETKFPTGEVLGKYGYVDDSGKTHEIEYGASKRGFEVAGTGINVPPPTLTNNNLDSTDYDDGQYREDPNIYLKETASGARAGPFGPPASRPAPAAPVRQQYSSPAYSAAPRTPSHIQQYFSQANQYNPAPAYNPEPAPAYRQPAPAYNPAPVYNPAPAYNPGPYYNPVPYQVDPNQFHGHPARNIDIRSGSYSVQYSG